MAGRGPAPKPSSRRARRNKDEINTTILEFKYCEQPSLPEPPAGEEWCKQTRDWWEMWGESAQAELFSSTDWDFLIDTALLHQTLWNYGDLSVLPELRLRVAKFGATLEDRARLRIQFAEADEADRKRPEDTRPSAKERAKVVQLRKIEGGETG